MQKTPPSRRILNSKISLDTSTEKDNLFTFPTLKLFAIFWRLFIVSIKATNLKKILGSKYIPVDEPSFIDSNKLKDSRFEQSYIDTYKNLDGKESFPVFTQKGYFFETTKFAISFDEQLSFNKYRIKTLRSEIYTQFKGIKLEKYRSYCKKYERECLKSGTSSGVWTNLNSEYHFGKSEAPGDLGLNGSSGWKMNACVDYLQDIYSLYAGKRLLRISVWDEILINKKLLRIGDLLNTPDKETYEHILKYIERRVINLFA